ncbi:alpha/beta hydrolase [Saccharobesus litoralis]|uniref:alpha/beta hydrolase n=1 Tax=Saccharobesus litoralis TaxID=2172099 RepID=UPI00131F16D3|nr:alpha/beta hydrolase [Saccharobesus litoralis]
MQKLKFIRAACIGITLLLAACTLQNPTQKPEINANQYRQSLSLQPLKTPKKVDNNKLRAAYAIKYGEHPRQQLDILLAHSKQQNQQATPLVIYVHGGGFARGDKSSLYKNRNIDRVNYFLSKGISIASVNYRFLKQSHNGVLSSMQDVMRAIQLLRHFAQKLNLQKDNVACQGHSAGAGTCLWLAVKDDMAMPTSSDPIAQQSTRIKAAAVNATQASYDVFKWQKEVFSDYIDYPIIRSIPLSWYPGASQLFVFYGINNSEQLYQPDIVKYRHEVDMLSHMSADDPPIWVRNTLADKAPINTNMLFHSPLHAKYLWLYAKKAGQDYVVQAPSIKLKNRSRDDLSLDREQFTCQQLLGSRKAFCQ